MVIILCCLRTTSHFWPYLVKKRYGIPQVTANRLQRWSYIVSGYSYDIEYVKSADNGNCDGLSRLPLDLSIKSITNTADFSYLKFNESTCMPISAKNVRDMKQRKTPC